MNFNLLDGYDQDFGLYVSNIFPRDDTDLFWDVHYERYFIHMHDVCW